VVYIVLDQKSSQTPVSNQETFDYASMHFTS